MPKLELGTLQHAISGAGAAFRSRTECQPVGGEGSPVFPPTYEGGKYAVVGYRDGTKPDQNGRFVNVRSSDEIGKKLADQIVLDSVQSQANRMEHELLEAWERNRITLPVITVDFSGHDLERELRVTSLEAPHRIADAILRDSLLDGVPFRKSDLGRRIDDVDIRNATALFELCPTALVFGMWDSAGPKGGLGAKFQRAIVSEIVGIDVQIGIKTASRRDPTEIKRESALLYRNADPTGIPWTADPDQAVDEVDKKGKPTGKKILYGRQKGKDVPHDPKSESAPDQGRPSVANHGNVTPSVKFDGGGVTIGRGVQTTAISLPALRRLRFPLAPGKRSDPKVDDAARTALAALALCAAALTRESGCDLRSRCQLFPTREIVWELLDKPGSDPQQFAVSGDDAVNLFNESVEAAKAAGLPWMEDELVLTPSPELVELVRRSQQLTASVGVVEE